MLTCQPGKERRAAAVGKAGFKQQQKKRNTVMRFFFDDAKRSALKNIETLPMGHEVQLEDLVDKEIWEEFSGSLRQDLGKWFRRHVKNASNCPMEEVRKDDQNHWWYRKNRPTEDRSRKG